MSLISRRYMISVVLMVSQCDAGAWLEGLASGDQH